MKTPAEYRDTHGVFIDHKKDYDAVSYIVVDVLPFLRKRPWDELALAFVSCLEPTMIRVTTGTIKLDARSGRVTVYVDEKNIIQKIERECTVWLPEGVEHGYHLEQLIGFLNRGA